MERLQALPRLDWYGPREPHQRVGVFSVRPPGIEPSELSALLESRANVLTRSGLHCAPLAHRTLGTLDLGGTTRFSFGPFTTVADIDAAADALGQIASQVASGLEPARRG
jgi:cysteine desulfurase / selenocysteine lyase